jgi:hypothetical protein
LGLRLKAQCLCSYQARHSGRRQRWCCRPRATFLAKGEAVVKAARAGSKLEKIIGMMQAAKRTTLAEMAKATKRKPAAVRGVIYNAVKKRLGLTVTLRPNEDRGTVFAIVEGK